MDVMKATLDIYQKCILRAVPPFANAQYVLRISNGPTKLGFLTAVLARTEILLLGLELRGEYRSWEGLLEFENEKPWIFQR